VNFRYTINCFDYLKYVLDIAWITLKIVCHLSEIHTYLDILYFLFSVALNLYLLNLVDNFPYL
jgi:hypothetical protein